MRYIGHEYEERSRPQRLAHYRKMPGFTHLRSPNDKVTHGADDKAKDAGKEDAKDEGLQHRAVWQADEVDDTGRATIRIVGPIDHWFGFEPDRIIEHLDAQDGLKHVHMIMTTPGGYLELAQTLYSDLRQRARNGVRVTAEGLALVASAGFDLFLAGDERTISDDTVMMQHPIDGFTMLAGCKIEMQQQYDEVMSHMDAFVSLNRRIIKQRTGQPDDVLDQWLVQPGEQWFSPEQALEYGLITKAPDGGDEEKEDTEVTMQQRAQSLLTHAVSGIAQKE